MVLPVLLDDVTPLLPLGPGPPADEPVSALRVGDVDVAFRDGEDMAQRPSARGHPSTPGGARATKARPCKRLVSPSVMPTVQTGAGQTPQNGTRGSLLV